MKENFFDSENTISFKKSLVLVCSTCSKQFSPELQSSSDRIKNELKTLAKDKYNKDVRIVNSSCLGICPKEKIAITQINASSLDQARSLIIPAQVDSQELFRFLFNQIE